MKIVSASGTPILGTSDDVNHLNETKISTYSNSSGICTTGNCLEMRDIVVKLAYYEPAVVHLRNEMFNGRALREVILSFQKYNALNLYDYYKITMNDVVITSITEVANGVDEIVTQITFKPTKSGWTYIGLTSGGKPQTTSKFGWNFATNLVWTEF